MFFKMASLKNLIIAVVCLSAGVSLCESVVVQKNLHTNYTLKYEVKAPKIELVIEAKTEGWLAFGFNGINGTMFGADYFMGYVNGSENVVGDYHTPNGTARSPLVDAIQNWELLNATETVDGNNVTTTRMAIARNLITNDTAQDHQIRNETIHLLWSYNADTDDRTARHSERGSIQINLITGEEPATPTQPTIPTTTPKSGVGIISVGISTFLMALVASVLKNF